MDCCRELLVQLYQLGARDMDAFGFHFGIWIIHPWIFA
jgi:hypothetical protein